MAETVKIEIKEELDIDNSINGEGCDIEPKVKSESDAHGKTIMNDEQKKEEMNDEVKEEEKH